MLIIVDIDGTVADISHREALLYRTEKMSNAEWKKFYAAADKDKPIPEVISVIQSLENDVHNTVVFSTGRDEEYNLLTAKWLHEHKLFYAALYMRKAGDHRDDTVVKSELLDKILKDYARAAKDGVAMFEDRQRVVDMYRKRGFRVFQVAKGDY